MGTSPRHFYGWQPKTFYHYDDQGRLEWSQTESVWNDYERMLLDALTDWESDLHTCGRQLSESLQLVGRPDPKYVVGDQVCLGCKALDQFWANRKGLLEDAHKEGRYPERYMLPRVYSESEAAEIKNQQVGQIEG